ncbi:unnamed protein product [Didymodactylos carnosus]|uniref:Uncharacterized protein n=1 Tax=Didymodactylos carnosus TaxID=1234261 RepID=A0A8S2KB73_9BILA|nr:unnamed protein product [Didymodactylos carnosus]CAF3842898.1 unnamed protein product [Didymodactylos carnosus]
MGLSSSKNKNRYLRRPKPIVPNFGGRSRKIKPTSRSIIPQNDYNYYRQLSSLNRYAPSSLNRYAPSFTQIPILSYAQLGYNQTGCQTPAYLSPVQMAFTPASYPQYSPFYSQLSPQSLIPYGTPMVPALQPYPRYQPMLQPFAQSYPPLMQPQSPLIPRGNPMMIMAPSSPPFQLPQPLPVYNLVQQQPQQFAQMVTDWTGGGQISPGFLGPPL